MDGSLPVSSSYAVILIVLAIALVVLIVRIVSLIVEGAVRRKRFSLSKYALETGSDYASTMSDGGARGEYQLGLELERFDPEGRLLFNVYVPHPDGSTSEVDALSINATGVYVFENKNYSGWIFGGARDRTWTQTFPNGEHFRFPNPVVQNEGHVRALQEFLGLDRSSFFSVVVFSDKCELKKVDGGDVPVIHTSEVSSALAKVRDMRSPAFGADQMGELYARLKACANATCQVRAEHVRRVSAAHGTKAADGEVK